MIEHSKHSITDYNSIIDNCTSDDIPYTSPTILEGTLSVQSLNSLNFGSHYINQQSATCTLLYKNILPPGHQDVTNVADVNTTNTTVHSTTSVAIGATQSTNIWTLFARLNFCHVPTVDSLPTTMANSKTVYCGATNQRKRVSKIYPSLTTSKQHKSSANFTQQTTSNS